MALNIPSPHEADFGGGLLKALMSGHQIKNNRTQYRQNDEKLAQEWQQHLNELAIRQAQEQRLADMAPHEIQELQARIGHHNAQSQGLAFDQNLLQQLLDRSQGGSNMPPPMPSPQGGPQSQFNAPPVMPTSSFNQLPEMGGQGNNPGNTGYDPIEAALIKKRLDIDVYDESPDKKDQRALENFIKKEQYKKEQEKNVDLTEVTPANRTAAQQVIVAANEVRPLLAQLIATDVPGAKLGVFSPEQQALANSIKNLSADDLFTIFNLPKDQHSLKMIEQLVTRQPWEGIEAYRKRLKWLDGRIEHKVHAATHLLKSGKVAAVNHEENLSDKNKSGMIKGILNGKEVSLHPSRRKQFEEQGGKIL